MNTRRDADAWFRQPVLWLGALILATTIVGCVVTIVLAWRFADPPVPSDERKVMNVPVRHAGDTAPPVRDAR